MPLARCDVFSLPFASGTSHLSFSDDVVEQPDIPKAPAALYRMLRLDGWLVIKAPSENLPCQATYYVLAGTDNRSSEAR